MEDLNSQLLEQFERKQAQNNRKMGNFVYILLMGIVAITKGFNVASLAFFVVGLFLFFLGYLVCDIIHKARVVTIKSEVKNIILQYHIIIPHKLNNVLNSHYRYTATSEQSLQLISHIESL